MCDIEVINKLHHNMRVRSQPFQNFHVCSHGTCQQWSAGRAPHCLISKIARGSPGMMLMVPISRWCRKGYHELNSGTLQMLMRPAAASGVLFDYACIPDIGTLVSASEFEPISTGSR
jgi:hypothetical protein